MRVMAQALVVVGIIALDVAAANAAEATGRSFWAVPLSILGAVWSWQHRRDRNIAMKFCLAIGMLISLGAFFARLIGELNDTRLVLAELLVQLQVLHSFDLPRRKDLGYSVVIGLILLGVAGTLSQTLAFGPFLLLFLAIALPVLVLDYRSRLGLVTQVLHPKNLQKTLGPDLSTKRLGLFFLAVVSCGLVIFACLPRLPGYQLRSFPVSAPVEFQGEFDGRQVINPGYSRGPNQDAEEEGGGGQGNAPAEGAGQMDPTYYYGFNTKINQNLRGELEEKTVLRVRSQAEGFWRVLSFDRYTGQGWEVSRNDQVTTLERPRWSYQFYLPRTAPLRRHREVIQTYTVVSDLTNLIPAMTQPDELYFPVDKIAVDPEGGLRSPLTLLEGVTYTVVSDVPFRDRAALGQAGTNYPALIERQYLEVPEAIADRVRSRTEEIIATSPKPLTNPYETSLYLAQYLKQRYSLQPDLPFLEAQEDLVSAFLFEYEGGYPDHFSTALTIMLRSVGIPARLVVGFGPGQFNPFTGLYIVKNTDAYAMTEVYFPRYGWFAFDPIPGHELTPPSIEESQAFSLLRKFWQWVAGFLPSPVSGWLSRVFGILGQAIGGVIAWFLQLLFRGWVGLFAGLLLLVSLSFLGWLGWGRWRSWRRQRWLAKLPPMERLYQQLLGLMAQWGWQKRPSQTPLEYAETLRQRSHSSNPQVANTANDIIHAYVSWRYGGRNSEDISNLQTRLKNLKRPRRPS